MNRHPLADADNRRLLSVAEDLLSGFSRQPLVDLAALCGMPVQEVQRRLRALMRAGVVRCVRQTQLSSSLTPGCLVAWHVPSDALYPAFTWLAEHDPATGHIVIREPEVLHAPGAEYRLWTTLRLSADAPSPEAHCRMLAPNIRAINFVCMPTVGMFRLGVGHLRRANLPPGTLDADLPPMKFPPSPLLNEQELLVLRSVCRPFRETEIAPNMWESRAEQLGMSVDLYCRVAERLSHLGLLGRFAVILDHTDPAVRSAVSANEAALLMWAVPPGKEETAGSICAQHTCMTHCYYRSGTQAFGNTRIMGMVHGPTRNSVREHKQAIDSALSRAGIPPLRSQILWTLRARIKS